MIVARPSSRSDRSVRTNIVSGVAIAVATVASLMTVSVTLMPAVSVGMVAVTAVVPAVSMVDALQIVPAVVSQRSVVGRKNNELVKLWMSSPPAPKHDVGAANPMDGMDPEQIARAQAYMEHQQNAPKIGYPTDVRSLVQYNHGFAVMSTNSKRYVRVGESRWLLLWVLILILTSFFSLVCVVVYALLL